MDTPKVLIADGDRIYRQYVRDYLAEKNDFMLFDVGSGETAMNIAARELPSVVLLDIVLLDMSGFDVCRKLKLDNQLKFVPVIIHTAKTGLKDRLSAYLLGAHHYLAKPCKMDDLYNCVLGALPQYDA